jgi:hypothetical protein
MLSLKNQKYTLEEYVELDHHSEEKIEYWKGHVFTLAGVSGIHDLIQGNTYFALRSKSSLECEINLTEIYETVTFSEQLRLFDVIAEDE